jgi:hypothetical protein
MKPSRTAARRYLPGSPFNTPVQVPVIETYEVGDQVTHDKYGLGVVLRVEGDSAVIIDFGPQKLRIAIPSVKLIKL